MDDSPRSVLALTVPKILTKKIKDALAAHGRLNKTFRIRAISEDVKLEWLDGDPANIREGDCYIPVTKEREEDHRGLEPLVRLIDSVNMGDHASTIGLASVYLPDAVPCSLPNSQTSLLGRTVEQWLDQQQGHGHERLRTKDSLLSCNWTYMIYPPLLLLPPSAFSVFSSILGTKGLPNDLSTLYQLICQNFKVSHIALNAPISESVMIKSTLGDNNDSNTQQQHPEIAFGPTPNVLRSPTGLISLYGDYGPDLPLKNRLNAKDLASAFWCTAQQNGIFQTWAPRYTMFSRGNISEKARVLKMESLTEKMLGTPPRETSAVDLYAGIGYFAFSYAKAGVGKVLCWEINPWSVEGLRRGSEGNKWPIRVVQDGEIHHESGQGDERLLVFQESNEKAAARIGKMRDTIPPVRHVNCGFLPSSNDSWEVAVQVLDSIGGWIHAHENIAKKSIASRTAEIVEIFTDLVKIHRSERYEEQWCVECEHLEQVKSYAPGVIHCVLDIAISPVQMSFKPSMI